MLIETIRFGPWNSGFRDGLTRAWSSLNFDVLKLSRSGLMNFPEKLLISLGIVAVTFVSCARPGGRPIGVSTTRAVRQNLTSWIPSNGKVEPVEPHVLQSQLTTFVQTVSVREGQTVKRGQLLMLLDAKDLESELARAKGELVTAEDEHRVAATGGSPEELAQLQSDLSKAETEIARLRREAESLDRLYAKQAATRQEIEQNKIALEKAEADKRLIEQKKNAIASRTKVQGERAGLRAEEARSAIRSLQEKLNSARVGAPVQGTIFSLAARPGTFVHTGDVLAELADLKQIRVRIFVDEPELGLLKDGQSVEITWGGLPTRVWDGRIEQLPKTIVARGSRNVGEVLCSVANPDSQLLPNTNVDIRIRTAERDNALTLPRSAVRTEANKHYVFVVEEGRLRRRDITVGISNSTYYEVLNGITENELIALPGASELHDGAPVTVS
jgi:HlyD family secretion protein